jgi:hypothetical protein
MLYDEIKKKSIKKRQKKNSSQPELTHQNRYSNHETIIIS